MRSQLCLSPIGLAIFLVLLVAGCAPKMDLGRNTPEEKRIETLLLTSKDSENPVRIDLNKDGSSKTRTICIQAPYQNRETFEGQLSRKVDTFEPIVDDVYVWWFFDADYRSFWIRVPRAAVMDKDKNQPASCANLVDKPLVVVKRSGVSFYRFGE